MCYPYDASTKSNYLYLAHKFQKKISLKYQDPANAVACKLPVHINVAD